MNDGRVQESFLPAPGPRPAKRLRKGPRVAVIVTAVVVCLAILGALAGILYWYFTDSSNAKSAELQSEKTVRIYSGHFSLSNIPYTSKYEDPESAEFKQLAEKLEKVIDSSCKTAPDLSSYFQRSRVFDYSEGRNFMAYYFAQFEIPPEDKDALSKFTDDALTGTLRESIGNTRRSFGLEGITVNSVSSSLANPDLVMTPEESK
ncbi:suppressor of tumorigenicity 14 protein homolog [Heterodontus francisci]|uniref:suppressor of tumorigenicity 14 protein homolog n=1 Tax=Heterodontus francisci TaxID=7792 RepID=UPI00355AF2FA